MLKFKVGQSVTQVVAPVQGTIKEARIVDGDRIVYIVNYETPDGETHERAFDEDQLA